MPVKYKVVLSLLVIIVGLAVIFIDNPDLSRVAFLYDYYLLPFSLLFKKYGNVAVILTIQLIMLIGLWIFPEAKGKITPEDTE